MSDTNEKKPVHEHRRHAHLLTVGAVLLCFAPYDAGACPPATPEDFDRFPSMRLEVEPEALTVGPSFCSTTPDPDESPCGPHVVYTPALDNPERQNRQNQLVVFLSGARSEPDKYEYILSMAAYTGYKTIGLSYDNKTQIADACDGSCGCYGPARREIVLGEDLSTAVHVRRGDAIVNRLYRLLVYLDTTDPDGGWGYFLNGNFRYGDDDDDDENQETGINWDAIVLLGHSQGVANAMVISKMVTLKGILAFDGGNEVCSSGGRTYPQWLDLPNKAGERRAFLFNSDSFALPASFLAMGFALTPDDFGVVEDSWPVTFKVATTGQEAPAAPADCTEHGAMAYDRCMPDALHDGEPAATAGDAYLFRPYSNWMCEVGK